MHTLTQLTFGNHLAIFTIHVKGVICYGVLGVAANRKIFFIQTEATFA